jgi:hypothetical protein
VNDLAIPEADIKARDREKLIRHSAIARECDTSAAASHSPVERKHKSNTTAEQRGSAIRVACHGDARSLHLPLERVLGVRIDRT